MKRFVVLLVASLAIWSTEGYSSEPRSEERIDPSEERESSGSRIGYRPLISITDLRNNLPDISRTPLSHLIGTMPFISTIPSNVMGIVSMGRSPPRFGDGYVIPTLLQPQPSSLYYQENRPLQPSRSVYDNSLSGVNVFPPTPNAFTNSRPYYSNPTVHSPNNNGVLNIPVATRDVPVGSGPFPDTPFRVPQPAPIRPSYAPAPDTSIRDSFPSAGGHFGVVTTNAVPSTDRNNVAHSNRAPSSVPSTQRPGGTAPPSSGTGVISGIKEFTLDILSTFRATGRSQKNIVFSPVSIASLLSLLVLGARGSSKSEIEIALGFPSGVSGNRQHEEYRKVLSSLNQESEGVNITTASRLFIDQNVQVKSTYSENARRYYNCSVSLENFSGNPDESRNRINKWVEQQTKGKIQNFISSPIPPTTKMILANTIYFSGAWAIPFTPQFTTERDFNTGKKIVKIPMMTNVLEVPHHFSEELNLDIVALPYAGYKFAMLIILPKETPDVKNIKELEKQLDTFYLAELMNKLTLQQVSVTLPRMKLSMKVPVKNNLLQLSVKSIFDPKTADFSDVSDEKPLYVDQILHDAVMEVTEEGTVAAAASSVMLDRMGGQPRVVVNKPAIIYIVEVSTGAPVFTVRLEEPIPI